jgi:hypothetical protein
VRPKKSYFSSACEYVKFPFSLSVLFVELQGELQVMGHRLGGVFARPSLKIMLTLGITTPCNVHSLKIEQSRERNYFVFYDYLLRRTLIGDKPPVQIVNNCENVQVAPQDKTTPVLNAFTMPSRFTVGFLSSPITWMGLPLRLPQLFRNRALIFLPEPLIRLSIPNTSSTRHS